MKALISKKDWAWRKRAAKRLPELAARVFALRGRVYDGFGFHYAMESNLGKVLADLNDFETPREVLQQVLSELMVEELYRDVALAERSAAKWEKHKDRP